MTSHSLSETQCSSKMWTPTESLKESEESASIRSGLATLRERLIQRRFTHSLLGALPFSAPKEYRSLTDPTQSPATSIANTGKSICSSSQSTTLWTPDEIAQRTTEATTQSDSSQTFSAALRKSVWHLSRRTLPTQAERTIWESQEEDPTIGSNSQSDGAPFPEQITLNLQTDPTASDPPCELSDRKSSATDQISAQLTEPWCRINETNYENGGVETATEQGKTQDSSSSTETGTRSTQESTSAFVCDRHRLNAQDTLYSMTASGLSQPTICSGSYCHKCHTSWGNQFLLKGYHLRKIPTQEKETQTGKSLEKMPPFDLGLNGADFWKKVLEDRKARMEEKPIHSVTIRTEDTFYPQPLPFTRGQPPFSNLKQMIKRENRESSEVIHTPTNHLWTNYIRWLCLFDPNIKKDPRFNQEIFGRFSTFLREPVDLSPLELAVCRKKFSPTYTFDQMTLFCSQIVEGEKWMMEMAAERKNAVTNHCNLSKGDYCSGEQTTPNERLENALSSFRRDRERPNSWDASSSLVDSKTLEEVSIRELRQLSTNATPRNTDKQSPVLKNSTRERLIAGNRFSLGNRRSPGTPIHTDKIRSLTKPKMTPRTNKAAELRTQAILEQQTRKKLFSSP